MGSGIIAHSQDGEHQLTVAVEAVVFHIASMGGLLKET
jgi:hypothetical protein